MQTSACGWWSSAAQGRNGWFGTGLNTPDNEEHNLPELESSHRHKPWDQTNSFGVNRFQYRRLKVKYYLWMIYCWVSIKQKAVITGERFARCKSSVQTPYLCTSGIMMNCLGEISREIFKRVADKQRERTRKLQTPLSKVSSLTSYQLPYQHLFLQAVNCFG